MSLPLFRYETRTLPQLYKLADEEGLSDEDHLAIRKLQENAYVVAKIFDKTVTEKYVYDYLEDRLEIGALIPLDMTACRTGETQSKSHRDWLDKLRLAKLKWNWEPEKKGEKMLQLKNSYAELQRLAYSYKNLSLESMST
jgi:hypothetical protein